MKIFDKPLALLNYYLSKKNIYIKIDYYILFYIFLTYFLYGSAFRILLEFF